MTASVWTEAGKITKLIPVSSRNLFPAGFAESHDLNIFIPEELEKYKKPTEMIEEDHPVEDSTEVKEDVVGEEESERKFIKTPTLPVSESSWCPRIYFNHLCYSASFLSKHKLESLPRFIGSGPVRLVMREVLSRLIGASFKSGAVLKKLEIGEDRKRRPDYWLEQMKVDN